MIYVMAKHEVKDFAKWQQILKQGESELKKAGCGKLGVYRDHAQTHSIVSFFEFDTIEHAKRVFEGEQIKQLMGQSGGSVKPEILFLDLVDKHTLGQVSGLGDKSHKVA